MKRKSTSLFTLVEILIAMGVCVIGVCSIMVLFPIGASASRDAAMETYAANAAEQILKVTEYCISRGNDVVFTHFTGWTLTDPTTYADGTIPDTTKTSAQIEEGGWKDLSTEGNLSTLASVLSQTISNDSLKIFSHNTIAGMYRLSVATSSDYTDFDCIVRMWPTVIYLKEPSTPGATDGIPAPRCVCMHVEVAWPADSDYGKQQKAEYSLDIFKPL